MSREGSPVEPPSSQLWAVWPKSSTLCFGAGRWPPGAGHHRRPAARPDWSYRQWWRWLWPEESTSAKRRCSRQEERRLLSNAIRRGEIVKEIVDHLRPWKDRASEATVSAEVNRELDILLQYVPRQARWSDRTRNRAHAQKLDGALREVEKLTRLASTPGYLAFLLFSPRSGPSPSISDIEHASQTFAAELKRMRKVCALAVDPRFGFHANYDHAKHLSSQSAHVLMKGMSEKKITGTEGGGFRTIASLLYEAISGPPDTDLKRSCDSVLRNIRGPQTGTHGSQ